MRDQLTTSLTMHAYSQSHAASLLSKKGEDWKRKDSRRLHTRASMLVKSQHFGLVVTSGVSRETSIIVWHVLVQQQLKHHNMLWLSDDETRRSVSRETPCVMTELLCFDLPNIPVRRNARPPAVVWSTSAHTYIHIYIYIYAYYIYTHISISSSLSLSIYI